MLVIFRYSTGSCAGNFAGWPYQLDPRRFPQVSGTTLLTWSLSGLDKPDFAFLQLSQAPPTQFIYAGWSFSTTIGETLYSLSHPRNLPKVYARGQVTETLNSDFFVLSMVEGRADHGSSGSGIFDDSLHLRGVLHAGRNQESVSACTGPSNVLAYTRFSSIYPQISQWLEGTSSADATPPQLTVTSHYDG